MNMSRKILTVLVIATALGCGSDGTEPHPSKEVKVRAYDRKDGTHVDSYERSAPRRK